MNNQTRHKTAEAAQYLTNDKGQKTSPRTLQAWRTKGKDDPGEKGPKFFKDPVTDVTYYVQADLDAWVAEIEARLVERGASQQPRQLAAA